MTGPDVSHGDLLDEIRALRGDLSYLAEPGLKKFLQKFNDEEFQGDALQGVEIIRAARVNGKGLSWLSKIVAAALMILGAIYALKNGIDALTWNGG